MDMRLQQHSRQNLLAERAYSKASSLGLSCSSLLLLPSSLSGATEATPVTSVQQYLQAASLSDDSLRSEESLSEDIELPTPSPGSSTSSPGGQLWKDIDQAEAQDPLFSAEYSPDIFVYMRKREVRSVHVCVEVGGLSVTSITILPNNRKLGRGTCYVCLSMCFQT